MDHKVSKDMISSGMIPSGEKTQADLGRTQYGSAPSPSSLMDAYRAIYEHHQKDADGNVIPHEEKEELNEGKMPEGLKNYLMKKKGKKEDKKDMKEQNLYERRGSSTQQLSQNRAAAVKAIKDRIPMNKGQMGDFSKSTNVYAGYDLFDLVKGKLIDEGCEEKEALKIMANMTKEEFDEVSEGLAGMALKLGGAALGAYGVKKAAEKMGTMSGTPKTKTDTKKPGLIQKLKNRTDATNKAIEQM